MTVEIVLYLYFPTLWEMFSKGLRLKKTRESILEWCNRHKGFLKLRGSYYCRDSIVFMLSSFVGDVFQGFKVTKKKGKRTMVV